MPLPVKYKLEDINVPANFDPLKHCGAYKAKGHTVCMAAAGMGTDHLGVDRCKFHGGASWKRRGAKADTLADRMDAVLNSPELLSVDRSIAFLQVWVEKQFELYGESLESWEQIREALSSGTKDGEPPAITQDLFPKLDLSVLDQLMKMVNVAFNMKYNKKNSVSMQELNQLVGSIVTIFQRIAEKYRLPREAAIDFATELRGLISNKQASKADAQLDYVSTEREVMVIDHVR